MRIERSSFLLGLGALLILLLGSGPAQAQKQPLWSYATGDRVTSVAISSDGNYIAVGSIDGKVYLFSRTSGTPLWSYATIGGLVEYISISSDGSYIVASDNSGRIYLFSRTSGTPLWTYKTGSDYVWSVSISADGNYIVAVTHGGYPGENI
jgi:WD40 repeat protein